MSISSLGWRRAISASTGATWRTPNDSGTLRRSRPTAPPACWASASRASSSSARMRSPRALSSSPASVGLMPRVVRLKSRVPSSASNRVMRRLTIDFETPRGLAARLNPPFSTTSTKALRSSRSTMAFLCEQQSGALSGHSGPLRASLAYRHRKDHGSGGFSCRPFLSSPAARSAKRPSPIGLSRTSSRDCARKTRICGSSRVISAAPRSRI